MEFLEGMGVSMRKLLVGFVFTLPLILFAQTLWQTNGNDVFHSTNIKWEASSISTDAAVTNVWVDSRNGYPQIFAQRITTEGLLQWAANGIPISGHSFSNCVTSSDFIPPLLTRSGNDILVFWLENRFTAQQFVAQKITTSGQLAWTQPIPFALYENSFKPVASCSDNDGGAYIFWLKDGHLYASHLTAEGVINPEFAANGVLVFQQMVQDGDVQLTPMSDGTVAVVLLAGETDAKSIFIQKMDIHGNLAFGTSGKLVFADVAAEASLAIASNGADVNFLFWRDYATNLFQSCMIDAEGDRLWPGSVLISTVPMGSNIHAILSSDLSAIFTWENGYLYGQKIDATGATLWGETGRSLTPMSSYSDSAILPDIAGGVWVTYRYQNTVRLQHADATGTLQFPLTGYILCNQAGVQHRPVMQSVTAEKYIISWQDWRNGSGELYYQLINSLGQPALVPHGQVFATGLDCAVDEVQIFPSSISPPLTLWADTRSGEHRYYFQELQGNGNQYYPSEGLPVTSWAEGSQEQICTINAQEDGFSSFIWKQTEGDQQSIRAQAIDIQGNYLWSDGSGVQLSPPNFIVDTPFMSQVANSTDKEVYCSWSATHWPNCGIFIQKLSDGLPQWNNFGRELVVNVVGNPYEIVGMCGQFILWMQDDLLFVLHFNEDGNVSTGWEPLGQIIGTTASMPSYGISGEGLVVVWFDNGKIREQIITPEGDLLLENEGKVLANASSADFGATIDGGIALSWLSFDNQLCLQTYSLSGTPLLPGDGFEISSIDSYLNPFPQVILAGSVAAITWNQLNDGVMGIKLALVDIRNNTPTLLTNEVICDTHFGSFQPLITTMPDNSLYLSWKDSRGAKLTPEHYIVPSSIFAQHYYLSPISAENVPQPTTVQLSNYPNPFNPTTEIMFNLTAEDAEYAKIEIFNIKGQMVKQLVMTNDNLQSGLPSRPDEANELVRGPSDKEWRIAISFSVTWDGTDFNNQPVTSGVYLYQLKANGKTLGQSKMMIIK